MGQVWSSLVNGFMKANKNRLGLVSGNLAPHVRSILGVDISQGVVDLFNKRFADRDADQERFRAIRAELKGEEGELDNEKFHVIIVRIAS